MDPQQPPQPQPPPQTQPQQQPPPPTPTPSSEPPPQQPPSSSLPSPQPPPPTNPNPTPTTSLPSYSPQQPNNRVVVGSGSSGSVSSGGGGPTSYNRPWSQPPPPPPQQQPTSQFAHFPPQYQSSSVTSSSSPSLPPPPRGGIAIGVPAHHPPASSSQPPFTVTGSFGSGQYGSGALPRNPVSLPDPSPARPTMQGMSSMSMGMIGSQIRPGGVPPSALHQQRPVQAASGVRPQTTSNSLPSVSQNFQGHGMLRASSVTPPSTSTPSTSQSQQSPHQPWLSAPHGRPPLPSQSFRPQVNSPTLQQRSHIPQQSPQPLQATSQPQQLLPSQQHQHFPASNQSHENYVQQLPSSRLAQPLANQQVVRVQGSVNQRPPSPAMGQASIVNSVPPDNTNVAEISESCSTILSKRNIQELVNQIDPSEKLDPEVEDVLVDIAEDFIDSVTTFGCSLAKHRKSNTLEAKDILLHLDRTWNMTLPGFSGDEIKTYKKPVVNDIHKERLALIKKSLAGAETGANKTSTGPATGNVKGHLAKVTPNAVGS